MRQHPRGEESPSIGKQCGKGQGGVNVKQGMGPASEWHIVIWYRSRSRYFLGRPQIDAQAESHVDEPEYSTQRKGEQPERRERPVSGVPQLRSEQCKPQDVPFESVTGMKAPTRNSRAPSSSVNPVKRRSVQNVRCSMGSSFCSGSRSNVRSMLPKLSGRCCQLWL